ncbi:MAG: small multi-drug export protein [Clostridioides sp.]|jgi:uncharacterized membrane protein|nr:small multi-drug export protein [Clostridioides sp.]
MQYLKVFFLSMLPIIELKGAIPLGIAMDLNPIGVLVVSVIGSSLVSIPLVLTFRHILHFLKSKNIFPGIVEKLDQKLSRGTKKLYKVSVLGLLLFVAVPLPTTGSWSASMIASILRMRLKDALFGVFAGNLICGLLVLFLSHQLL